MRGRFDTLAAKEKKRDQRIEELVKEVKEQKKTIAELTKALKVDKATKPVEAGLPFKSVAAFEAGLKDAETRRQMLAIAASIPKDMEFMRNLHTRLLHLSLMQRLYGSARE